VHALPGGAEGRGGAQPARGPEDAAPPSVTSPTAAPAPASELAPERERDAVASPSAAAPAPRAVAPPAPPPTAPRAPAPTGSTSREATAPRPTIGAVRQRGPSGASDAAGATVPAPTVDVIPGLDRDELTRLWGDKIFPALSSGLRSTYRSGRWLAVEGGTAVFAFDHPQFLQRGEEQRAEVEEALAAHFGARVGLRLVLDPAVASAPASPASRPPSRRGGGLGRGVRPAGGRARRPRLRGGLAFPGFSRNGRDHALTTLGGLR
jgi:hypothetical protein